MYEIMIPGHFIARNESCKILLHFPKDSKRKFKFETNIFNILNFGRQRLCLLPILFLKKKIDQVGQTSTYFGDKMTLEIVKGCQ